MFLNAKSPDQFAEFKTVYKSTFASAALLVDADLLLWEVKSTELNLASDIVNFIHQEIFDAFLCGFTAVLKKIGLRDTENLCSYYIINVVIGQRPLEVKSLNTSSFCL